MAGHGAWVGMLLLGAVTATSAALAADRTAADPAPLPKESGPSRDRPGTTADRPGSDGPDGTRAAAVRLPRGRQVAVQPEPATRGAGRHRQHRHRRVQRQPARAGRQGQPVSVQRAADDRQLRAGRARRQPGRRATSSSRSPARCASNTIRRPRSRSSPTAQSVVVRDRKLATQDLYPLSQTPLRFLLADRIDLLRDTNVVGIRPTTSSSPS